MEETKYLDDLPDDVILKAYSFFGNGYVSFGSINRRFKQLFDSYGITKETYYWGCAPAEEIIEKFEQKLAYADHDDRDYFYQFIDVCQHIADSILTFNRKELYVWALRRNNKHLLNEICSEAIHHGRIEVLKDTFECQTLDKDLITYMKELPWLCRDAVESGNLTILQYLHEKGFKWDYLCCDCAASKGHVQCLRYLHEHGCEWGSDACMEAASNGNLDCLMYLHEQGCPWNSYASEYAAHNGKLECLKYLHEQGCEWEADACDMASVGGHLECLRYLHENGCEWTSSAFEYAAAYGNLECLKYLNENGCERAADACMYAAANGELQCLMYLHEHGCEWLENECTREATSRGQLECLKYLYEHGCKLHDDLFIDAAHNGHLDCLVYLHEVSGIQMLVPGQHMKEN